MSKAKTITNLENSILTPEEVFFMGLRLHHIATTAYPIGHRITYKQYRLSSDESENALLRTLSLQKKLGFYVHIPFCEQRCKYCEYTVFDRHNHEIQREYMHLLLKEFRMYKKSGILSGIKAMGLDIGGGTPSILSTNFIYDIVDFFHDNFKLDKRFQISIETTPKIAAQEIEKLETLHKMGIDRISMGIQTVKTSLLTEHGRDYNKPEMNKKAVFNIKNSGFKKFNIDIMYGFARQDQKDLEDTIRYVANLKPDSITTYRMRYKGTGIEKDSEDVPLSKIQEMYSLLKNTLKECGYNAPPGRNTFTRDIDDCGLSAYLRERVVHGTAYLGFGAGAQSFTTDTLVYNCSAATKRIDEYKTAIEENRIPIQDLYSISTEEGMAKMISVSFYSGAIHLPSFKSLFGISLEERFPAEVSFLIRNGLMIYDHNLLRLSDKGALYINGVIPLFYSETVKEYLHKRR